MMTPAILNENGPRRKHCIDAFFGLCRVWYIEDTKLSRSKRDDSSIILLCHNSFVSTMKLLAIPIWYVENDKIQNLQNQCRYENVLYFFNKNSLPATIIELILRSKRTQTKTKIAGVKVISKFYSIIKLFTKYLDLRCLYWYINL